MRVIGKRTIRSPGLMPSAEALRIAAVHQETGQALAAVVTTGIPKGIYRFKSHEEMNRFDDDALVRAIVINMRARGGYV
ncbi:MAG: hypothetical protein ACKVQT_13585 [Burkholderiales bacterium]